METIRVKEEPVDDGYNQALAASNVQTGGQCIETDSKPTGKSKLLKLLFSSDVPPLPADSVASSTCLSNITDKNGSSVKIKTEKIKTEVVDPEYEGNTKPETENSLSSKGSNSTLFSLLTTAADSSHHTPSNLHTSHKNLSSLLASPSMNHTQNMTYTERNSEFKANNMANRSCSALLKMLTSPGVPVGSQGNGPGHVFQGNQLQSTGLNSNMSNSAQKNLNMFDTTLKAMLEKPVCMKNTSNKGLVELLNKGVENKQNDGQKSGSLRDRPVRNRLDATINMLMNKPENVSHGQYDTNGEHLLSGGMSPYNQWIDQMSSILTKQALQSEQEHRSQGYSAGPATFSQESQLVQKMSHDAVNSSSLNTGEQNMSAPNVVVDKEGAMFITVNPQPLDFSTKKRGLDKGNSMEDNSGKKKKKKSFEHLKAELLKPNIKKDEESLGPKLKIKMGNRKKQMSKKNTNLSSLLKFKPLNEGENTPNKDLSLKEDSAQHSFTDGSPVNHVPVIKQEPVEKTDKIESQIRSILQLPTLNDTKEHLRMMTSHFAKGQGRNESTLNIQQDQEQQNVVMPNFSEGQGHSETLMNMQAREQHNMMTSNFSQGQGHCESTTSLQAQEQINVMTPNPLEGQGHSESTMQIQGSFQSQFPASSIMMQLSDKVGDQYLPEPTIVQLPGQQPEFWIYKCKQCNKTFRHAGTLKVHERAHSYEREEFKCNICGKVCSAAGYLAIHMRTHFPEKVLENKGIFTCSVCKDTFSEKENLLIHLRMHSGEKLFKCEVCSNGFTRKTQLLIHMRIHTGEKPYKCEICGKTFRQSNGLNLHMTTHTDDKPYKCEICNKGFGRKAHYDKHMRKHRGERPFVCSECGKGFTDKFNLTMHTKIHNKEKDHICGICNKGYNQTTHLKNHMKFHTGELGYKCVFCQKTTEFKREMYTHFKGDHHEIYLEFMAKKKMQRYYEILNPKFVQGSNPGSPTVSRELDEDDSDDDDDTMDFDYDSEAESGADNPNSDDDAKEKNESSTENYDTDSNTLPSIKQEPMDEEEIY